MSSVSTLKYMKIFPILKKSLHVKLIIAVIVFPSAIHGIFSAVKIVHDREPVYRDLEATKERVVNELSLGLSDPLWDNDLPQAKALIRLKLKERHFVGITIQDLQTGGDLFSIMKREDRILEVEKSEIDSTWVISVDIAKNNVVFWKAHCYFTDRFVKEVINRNIWYSLLLNLLLTTALTLALITTLHILVIRPISRIKEIIKHIADGDFSNRIDVPQADEIGEIGNAVNNLLVQLESTISEVNLVMEAMSVGDFSKRITVTLAGDLNKLKNHTNRSIEVLAERTRQLKEVQQELIDKAHRAGMADVASGTLHNVGNILNSVKISAQIVQNDVNKSHLDNFFKANELLRENIDSLDDFILNNPNGKKLFEYYLKLESVLEEEKSQTQSNLIRLTERIDMIAGVILAQQNYAGISALTENYSLDTIIDDALTLQSGNIERYGIRVIKKLGSVPLIPIQKAKLVHILINLIKNAKESMLECPKDKRTLTISSEQAENCVVLKIQDTGKGIETSSLKKIFTHGYTTKDDGHGFGLHSCANYMREMKGKIWAESDGLDKGATFVLEFILDGHNQPLIQDS